MRYVLIVAMALVMAACAAKPIEPGAQKVFVSNDKPSDACEYVGEVIGGQGNWWTDDITSEKNAIEGSRNELRNEAFKLGANYVHVQQTDQSETYLGGQAVSVVGHAYKCP